MISLPVNDGDAQTGFSTLLALTRTLALRTAQSDILMIGCKSLTTVSLPPPACGVYDEASAHAAQANQQQVRRRTSHLVGLAEGWILVEDRPSAQIEGVEERQPV